MLRHSVRKFGQRAARPQTLRRLAALFVAIAGGLLVVVELWCKSDLACSRLGADTGTVCTGFLRFAARLVRPPAKTTVNIVPSISSCWRSRCRRSPGRTEPRPAQKARWAMPEAW